MTVAGISQAKMEQQERLGQPNKRLALKQEERAETPALSFYFIKWTMKTETFLRMFANGSLAGLGVLPLRKGFGHCEFLDLA